MAQLTFGTRRLTFGGLPLVFGGVAPTPIDPIYSAAWMPVIRLDRKGRPIDPEKLEVNAAFERIEAPPPNRPDPAVFDGIAAELQGIADLLPGLQMALIAELQALAYDMELIAEDEREIELLLLGM